MRISNLTDQQGQIHSKVLTLFLSVTLLQSQGMKVLGQYFPWCHSKIPAKSLLPTVSFLPTQPYCWSFIWSIVQVWTSQFTLKKMHPPISGVCFYSYSLQEPSFHPVQWNRATSLWQTAEQTETWHARSCAELRFLDYPSSTENTSRGSSREQPGYVNPAPVCLGSQRFWSHRFCNGGF